MKNILVLLALLNSGLIFSQEKVIMISRDTIFTKKTESHSGTRPGSNNFVVLTVVQDSAVDMLVPVNLYSKDSNLLDGQYIEFYPHGSGIKILGNYTGNVKSGRWFYYDSNGYLAREETWFAGKLKITKLYKTKLIGKKLN